MDWASQHTEQLQRGETVQFRPRGNSMSPRIKSGQLCTVAPADSYKVGDIVLCRVRGRAYLHLVKAIRSRNGNDSFQIGNNRGHINGWTTTVFGKLVSVE